MNSRDVTLLGYYLERYPELKDTVEAHPPRIWFRRRWRVIQDFRVLKSGIEFTVGCRSKVRFSLQNDRTLLRGRFRARLLDLLPRHLPDWRILKVSDGTSRNYHQTATFLRLYVWNGRRRSAVLVAYPEQGRQLSERFLSSALLWRHSLQNQGVDQLLLFVPEFWSERFLNSVALIGLSVTCYKYDMCAAATPSKFRLRKIYPRPAMVSRVGSPFIILPYRHGTAPLLREIRDQYRFLDLVYRQGRWELDYKGLRVAWSEDGTKRCFFDADSPKLLDASAATRFEQHLQSVARFRRFPPQQPTHPYYRSAEERWLESLILRDHSIVNRDFEDVIYSQVPTCLDKDRKVLDLLTATRKGRLAVLELKVDKDLNLLFQALDYWERVWCHLKNGDFQRDGYFQGMNLSDEPPLLYLVSPLFEFHRETPSLRKYLRGTLNVGVIGINSDWKRRLKVLRRFDS